jgi:predicted dinucleotide-binding enzyme
MRRRWNASHSFGPSFRTSWVGRRKRIHISVKAFNTIYAQVLGAGAVSTRAQVFYASDDAGAKAAVRGLIESMGFEAVDAGPLVNARLLEPLGMLNIYLGYGAGRRTGIAPAWVRVA